MHLGIVISYRFNTRVVADKLATGLFQIIVDKIITVKYATYAVAKRKPEKKIRFAGIRTLASATPVLRSS